MALYLGIQPTQVVHSRCGGGVAAVVPWFALQFLEPPTVGAPTSPKGIAVPAATYPAQPRRAVLVTDWQATKGRIPEALRGVGQGCRSARPRGLRGGVALHRTAERRQHAQTRCGTVETH